METKRLHQLCGIDNLSIRDEVFEPRWIEVTLKFIGGDDYILGTKRVKVALQGQDQGFGLFFEGQLSVPASALLGKQVQYGTLYDTIVCFDEPTDMPQLSLASLSEGLYPAVLRNGDTVRLT